MAAATPSDLLLFVSGEPGPADDPEKNVVTSIVGRMVGQGLLRIVSPPGNRISGSAAAPAAEKDAWHVSRQGMNCVKVVLEVAERAKRHVTLVNVNDPGDQAALVARWVREDDVFPVLVRPDGGRLVGSEQFEPADIRRFLRVR